MRDWHRRSVLATGVGLSVGSGFASAGLGETNTTGDWVADLPDPAVKPNPAMDEDWASYAGNAGHSRYIDDGYEFDGDALEAVWSVDHAGPVAVADETVYTTTATGVVAFDATDGSLIWENADVDATTPSVVGETVYLSGDEVVALDRSDGSVRWKTDFEADEYLSDQTVAYDGVYVVVDGTLYALEASDGSVRWFIESVTVGSSGNGEADEYEFVTSAAAANGVVYAATAGVALALEPESGNEVWRSTVNLSNRAGGYQYDRAQATTTGAVLGRFTYNRVNVVDAKTGAGLRLGLSAGVDIALGESVYVSGDDWDLFGKSLENPSDRLWDISLLHTSARPVISDETVYVYIPDDSVPDGQSSSADYSDELVALSKRDGTEKWAVSADDVPVGMIRAISGTTIYVDRGGGHDGDNKLVALRAQTARLDKGSGDGGRAGGSHGNSSDGGNGDGDTSDDETTGNETATGNESSASENAIDGDSGGEDEAGPGGGDGDGSVSSDTEDADSADDVAGFTTGAGIVGGALGLEWLRRHTDPDD
ncbi:PQQ-binding-like beta-propeller repeat protein [Natrinema halophilum]|uniref:PQQ-binding-like beta-propeller repeat protein n=1 Tax=Natrinema halophilum TaxID=1699371 RepID=A0A7D5L3G4_9EURY|nr:PQQ-binding-like beta-propeller repeat protein [Natrinema halophilum]QLG49725.1 PQQ-like beta-propeller repeat protein [Natrinema halophilum]